MTNYQIYHHIVFPVPANDNCGLAAAAGLPDVEESPLHMENESPREVLMRFLRWFGGGDE